MVFLEIKPQQNGSASTSGLSAADDETRLIAPSQSQRPQKANPAETAREMEEKDTAFGEDQKTVTAGEEARQKKRLADAGPKEQWDGFITDQPPFPLSELIALKPCSFSTDFYAYARWNGRTGVIKTDLIEDILKNSPRIPLDDAAMMPVFQPEPEDTGVESEVEGKKSKDKQKSLEGKRPRAKATRRAAADSALATEAKISSQTFEQVCEELKTYMQEMDTPFSTESQMRQTGSCRGNRSLVASSSPPAPSAIDTKINKRQPKKTPPFPIFEAKSLRDFDGIVDTKHRGLQQSLHEWKSGAVERADDDHQGFMLYSEAAKAAARYYTLTSAYGKPFRGGFGM